MIKPPFPVITATDTNPWPSRASDFLGLPVNSKLLHTMNQIAQEWRGFADRLGQYRLEYRPGASIESIMRWYGESLDAILRAEELEAYVDHYAPHVPGFTAPVRHELRVVLEPLEAELRERAAGDPAARAVLEDYLHERGRKL